MTDRGIPDQIKTGFNLIKDDGQDVIENIASIVLVFMENAVKSADIYDKHAKRNTITSEDIKRALMLDDNYYIHEVKEVERKMEDLAKRLDELIERKNNYKLKIGYLYITIVT